MLSGLFQGVIPFEGGSCPELDRLAIDPGARGSPRRPAPAANTHDGTWTLDLRGRPHRLATSPALQDGRPCGCASFDAMPTAATCAAARERARSTTSPLFLPGALTTLSTLLPAVAHAIGQRLSVSPSGAGSPDLFNSKELTCRAVVTSAPARPLRLPRLDACGPELLNAGRGAARRWRTWRTWRTSTACL